MRISVGCGKRKEEDFIGIDHIDFGHNKIWDANKDEPMPFEDSSVSFAKMHNTMEHIARPRWPFLFNELWRVLKPNGVLEIIVPNAESVALCWQDPTHLGCPTKGTFTQYLTGARPRNADYGFKKWIVLRCEDYEVEPRDIFVHMKKNTES